MTRAVIRGYTLQTSEPLTACESELVNQGVWHARFPLALRSLNGLAVHDTTAPHRASDMPREDDGGVTHTITAIVEAAEAAAGAMRHLVRAIKRGDRGPVFNAPAQVRLRVCLGFVPKTEEAAWGGYEMGPNRTVSLRCGCGRAGGAHPREIPLVAGRAG
jgi:hypothetical protein